MTGLKTLGNGNLKCIFCNHKSYKRYGDAVTHVQNNHELELANATIEDMRDKLTYANKAKAELSRQLAEANKPKPKDDVEYWYPRNAAGIYCPTCKIVNRNAGIPVGQTIENTPHSPCNNRGLMLVLEVK